MKRQDQYKTHQRAYKKNKKYILKTQDICGICGNPVDKTLKYPDPMCGVVDHIIPLNKGGHPSDINNLQLAHHSCNRQKSDKLFKDEGKIKKEAKVVGNRNLPQSRDWRSYRSK